MNVKSFLKILPILILIGTILGLGLGLMSSFATEEQLKILEPAITFIIILVVIYVFARTIINAIKFNKETHRLLKILFEEVDVKKYIHETEATIRSVKRKLYKLHFSLNLAIGFEAEGEYQKAISYMKNLNIEEGLWIYKAIYYNNLAYFYCKSNNLEKALATFSEGDKFINKLLAKPQYNAAPLHTKALIEYLKGNLKESEELFENTKLQINSNNHLVTASNLYLAKIYLKTGRVEKAKVLIEYNLSQKLLPNILNETELLLGELRGI